MYSKATIIAALLAVAEARFGQEQVPISKIAAVQGGNPGAAQTIAGQAVSDLLAGANACSKLQRADDIVAQLGDGADAISAAIDLVAAEKNFNPFAQSIPTICSDPTLPTTLALRGITPLIDPAVGGSDVANALSAQTIDTPLKADGLSVADLLAQNGFTNFTTQDLAGNTGAAPAGDAAAEVDSSADASTVDANASNSTAVDASAAASNGTASAADAKANDGKKNKGKGKGKKNKGKGKGNKKNKGKKNKDNKNKGNDAAAAAAACNATATAAADASASATADATAASTTAADAAASSATDAAAASGAAQKSTLAGVDFGQCVPTMKFEGGLGGRPATEFTFQAIDALVAKGQQEALNPNIITNRICDQLTNVCEANQAAKDACTAAKAQVTAANTRDKSTADLFNTALGFAGAVTNPDGGPADKPAATAAANKRSNKTKHRRVRRGASYFE